MSVARPVTRRLVSRCLSSSLLQAVPCHQFHSSASCSSRKRSRFRNVKAAEMGLTSPEAIKAYAKTAHPDYTPEELEALKAQYTPEQYEAILAAEAAIDPKDLSMQGRLRDDPYRINYLEDFAIAQPIIDVKPESNVVAKELKWLGHKEWVDDYIDKLADRASASLNDSAMQSLAKALRKVKVTAGDMIDLTEDELESMEADPELRKQFFEQDVTLASGRKLDDLANNEDQSLAPKEVSDEAVAAATSAEGNHEDADRIKRLFDEIDEEVFKDLRNKFASETENPLESSKIEAWKAIDGDSNSALAPELGKVEGVKGLYKVANSSGDEPGELQAITRTMGMNSDDIMSFVTKVLVTRFVHNQTRLGKIRSISIVAVAGNGNGRLGIGQAKSTEASVATRMAKLLAIRNMKPIRRYEERTIYGSVESKVGGTVVQLQARPPGFGLRVSHRIFEMCRAGGIHDLAAKVPRSRNPMNTVKAAYNALLNQPNPDEIAIGRGKKLVDVRKVYYGGSVY